MIMSSFFPLAFLDVGMPELILILFVALLLFGGKKLPELAKGLGQSIREFKKATAGVEEEIKRAIEAAPEPRPKPPTVLPAETVPSTVATTTPPAATAPAHVGPSA